MDKRCVTHFAVPSRRRFLARAGAAAVAALVGAPALAVAAPAARVRIASLFTRSVDVHEVDYLSAALRAENAELAARITLSTHYANFDPARLAQLARQVLDLRPALIVCHDQSGLQAVLAARTLNDIPVVFRSHDDPLAHGLIGSYARPGRNVTGITTYRCADDKMIEILHDALPALRRIGFVYNAAIPDGGCHARARQYAASQGIALHDFSVASADQIGPAFDQIHAARIEAMIVPASAPIWKMRKQVVERMDTLGIPAIYEGEVFVNEGGLMHFGAILDDTYARMARDIVKIVNGENAGDIPVSQPNRFELVVNMKAARARSFGLSGRLLRRADRIIE